MEGTIFFDETFCIASQIYIEKVLGTGKGHSCTFRKATDSQFVVSVDQMLLWRNRFRCILWLSFSFKRKLYWNSVFTLSAQNIMERKKVP